MPPALRQEVFNVVLAQLLAERGVISSPENMLSGAKRTMPDVIVNFNGLRAAIEAEVNDQPDAKEKARASALRRVTEGIAHVGIAVVYPADIRNTQFDLLKQKLSSSVLEFSVLFESGEIGYISGKIRQLEETLRRAFQDIVREDVVAEAVEIIDQAIDHFSIAILGRKADLSRVASSLGILEFKATKELED
jgi:hypothetical protein